MKCISPFHLFCGLGRSACYISIQLVQMRIVKAFFLIPATEYHSLSEAVYV